VAIRDGRIAWVARRDNPPPWRYTTSQTINCHGKTLLPGFNDAHIHLLALASSLIEVDCTAKVVASIDDIKSVLSTRAKETPAGQWVRGHGYNEYHLSEQTHPSKFDLDAASIQHPLRLDHFTKHACILNSLAMLIIGINKDTPDPPGGIIERDSDGQPTGLLLEMNDYVSARMGITSEISRSHALDKANDMLISMGITSVQDATHTNDLTRWSIFKQAKQARRLLPRLTFMPAISQLGTFLKEGLGPETSINDDINIGPAKVMLTLTGGSLHPSIGELKDMIHTAANQGFPVAIHAIEAECLQAVLQAIEDKPIKGLGPQIRIEHCSECPPSMLQRLIKANVTVVTQPAFIYYSGQRYLNQVSKSRLPWLYSTGSIYRTGIPIAFSSDAPVSPLNPLIGLYAAITRQSEAGPLVNQKEAMAPQDAIRAYTLGGASASSQQHLRGSIELGKQADLIMLSIDPTSHDTSRLLEGRVELTVIGGRIVYQG
jgi:predicted amidohydrolase YtcJ